MTTGSERLKVNKKANVLLPAAVADAGDEENDDVSKKFVQHCNKPASSDGHLIQEVREKLHYFELSSKLLFKQLVKQINEIEHPELASAGQTTVDSSLKNAEIASSLDGNDTSLKLAEALEREVLLNRELERLTRSEVKLIEDVARLTETQQTLRRDLLKSDQLVHQLQMQLAVAVNQLNNNDSQAPASRSKQGSKIKEHPADASAGAVTNTDGVYQVPGRHATCLHVSALVGCQERTAEIMQWLL